MATPASANIAIIIGSQRQPRAGPQIATFVHDVIAQHHQQASPTVKIETVDIAALGLPLYDEPGIPQQITDPAGYAHEHTRAWSRLVSSFDGFVFVTPQYNWGVPAGLKNAIDYLFNEWTGKAAMVVSYGGHGGGKADDALRAVLGGGLKMRVAEGRVNLTFWGRDVVRSAFAGEDLGLAAGKVNGPWSDAKGDIVGAWEELLGSINQKSTQAVA